MVQIKNDDNRYIWKQEKIFNSLLFNGGKLTKKKIRNYHQQVFEQSDNLFPSLLLFIHQYLFLKFQYKSNSFIIIKLFMTENSKQINKNEESQQRVLSNLSGQELNQGLDIRFQDNEPLENIFENDILQKKQITEEKSQYIIPLKEESQVINHQRKEGQQIQLKKKYYDFFKSIIPDPYKYVPNMPSDQQFKKHKIKLLYGNQFYQNLQSYHQPYIRINNTERQATIVIYTVIVGIFELEITLLNIDPDAKIQKNKIGSGSFGSVRIQSQNKRMFAVKRQMFQNKYHMKQFNMMANKYEINEVIKQLAIYKICSLFKIGPAAETDIGFDLICYRDCIEFQIQYCIKTEYQNGIFVDKSKFEKQIKQCLLTLHLFRIIHKDIKPANILFSIKYNKYVLTDFGISHPVSQKIGYLSETFCEGSFQYMSKQMKNIDAGKKGYVHLYGNDTYSLEVALKKQMMNQNLQQRIKQFKLSKQYQNAKYEYEYLKLKYYCIKPNSKMEEVQSYWKIMNNNILNQLIGIVDKSIDYDKIKSVYNYLSKQQKFKDFNLDNLRIQSQSIKSLKIEPDIKQNTLLQLKNMLRVYGYSLQVKEIIIKLKLQQKYKSTLKIIHKVLDNEKDDKRDRMFGDHRNYIKKIKKQLQKFQQQQNNQQVFKRYMIILQYGDKTEQLETIQKLKKVKYERKKEEVIEQKIRVIKIQKKKQQIQKLIQWMNNINDIEQILKEKKLYDNVAQIYGQVGQYKTALTYKTKSINILISFHGQQHPNISRTYYGIAGIYNNMSKYETALTFYTRSLNMDISFHGQQHPHIAATYNNIALVYINMGKYETALTYYTKSLNILISFHGQQHPTIAITYNGIAGVYDNMGNYELALTYYTKSLSIDILFHGQQHPNIATIYNNIASVDRRMGKYQTALSYYTKSLNILISFHGQQHPNIARTYNGIAGIYDNIGNYELAMAFYTKSLKMDISFHGQQHPNIARTYNNIASVYHKIGNYETALSYFTKSLNIDISFHGQKHPNIATTYNNIASVYNNMGKYQTALSYYTKSLKMDISFHGQQHPNIATTYNNIALVYNDLGKYDTALTYYNKSLKIEISFHGQQYPNIAKTCNNIALLYRKLGKYELALTFYTKSLNIDISFHRQKHPNIARTYNNIASVYDSMGKYEIALTYYTKSLNILISIIGQKHPNIASLYNNLAINYFNLDNCILALKFIYNSIKIKLQLSLLQSSPQVANNYHTLSNIFLKKNKYFQSLHYAYLALDTFLKFNPLDHPQSPNCISLLAKIYYQMNRFIQSYFFYRLSCQILVRYFPIHYTNVRNSKHMMNEMEWSMPQSIHNYTSNIEFINNIKSKYSQLPKHKLIKLLFAKKSQLRFEQQHRSRRDSFEYLKCVIQIFLCYKYLGYLREQKKLGDSMKEELQRIQQSQQKSMFRELTSEISDQR